MSDLFFEQYLVGCRPKTGKLFLGDSSLYIYNLEMEIQPLIKHMKRLTSFSDEAIRDLSGRATEKKLRRRQYLLQEGDICKYYHFVRKGCLRMYLADEKGSEHILQFAVEGWWIADIGSFHSERPSRLNIDALEASEVIRISKPDLISLYEQHPAFDRYFRVLTENAFISMQDRVLQNISSTAEERYLVFLDRYPDLSNRISQVQIASYIGVTPEFLSAIRKQLMKK